MRSHDLETVLAAALARLCAIGYPGAPTTQNGADTWIAVFAETLGDADPKDVDRAFAAYFASADPADRYMPTPGRIRALLPAYRALAEAKAAAGEVWAAVLRLASDVATAEERVGSPKVWGGQAPSPAVLAAVLAGVAACGGWRALGYTPEPDRALGGAFRRSYEAALDRATAPGRALPGADRVLLA